MTIRAHFSGGPCDGADVKLDVSVPPRLVRLCNAGVVTTYHYVGFGDGVAYYSIEPVEVLTTVRSLVAA